MIEPHTHDEQGNVVFSEPSPANSQVDAVEAETRADVEIARIESDTAVQLAKIAAKSDEHTEESRVAQLEAEIKGMKEILDRLAGGPAQAEEEPEPVAEPAAPIVVAQDSHDEIPAPPEHEEEHHESPKKSRGLGLWG